MKFEFNQNTFDKDPKGKGASIISKLFLSIFFLFFGGMGSFFSVLLVRDLIRGQAKWTMAFFLMIPLVFMLIGFGGLYGTWLGKQKDKSKIPKAKHPGKQLSKRGAFFAGVLFVIVGSAISYWLLIRPLMKIYQAQSWIETPCTIISAEVKSHDSDDGTTYSIDITYEYEFNTTVRRCNRYDFMGGSSSGYAGKREIINRYQTMTAPVCYVNPENPSEAVLLRTLTLKNAIGLFPLIFVAAGLAVMIGAVKHRGRKGLSWLPQMQSADHEPAENKYAFARQTLNPEQDSVTLKPDASQFGKLIFVLIFCLFWNGVVSIFVHEAIQSFRSGRPQWGLTLFLIPFVLIGLGFVGAVFYQILALFNPRYTLTLKPGQLYPGTTGLIDWNVRGRAHRIGTLSVKLLGKEEAQYQVGTNTCTASDTFFEMELFKTQDYPDIAAGQIGFVIPQETMHSFEADNNKIIWSIHVHGDIARWPDVKQDYKIIISPQPIT